MQDAEAKKEQTLRSHSGFLYSSIPRIQENYINQSSLEDENPQKMKIYGFESICVYAIYLYVYDLNIKACLTLAAGESKTCS